MSTEITTTPITDKINFTHTGCLVTEVTERTCVGLLPARVPTLRRTCRAAGLKVSGTRAELVARLVEHYAGRVACAYRL